MNKQKDSVISASLSPIPSYDPIIEIHVSCKNLKKLDIGSQSDPICIFKTIQNSQFIEEDRTEIIYNNQNPNFVKTFKTSFKFQSNLPLRFEVYDCDSNNPTLKNHDFIGYCEVYMQQIVTNLDQSITFELFNDQKDGKRGQLILTCQQTKISNANIRGQIQVNKLKKMKTFSKNNPFFELSKPSESNQYISIYRSEVKSKCYGCTFKEFTIPLHILCRNNIDDPITISFFDYRSQKPPKLIGKCQSNVRNFMESIKKKFDIYEKEQKFDIYEKEQKFDIYEKEQKFDIYEKEQKSVGEFNFTKMEVIQIPTFADYLKSGIQLNMITAIDFTMSNGSVSSKNSLHYISSNPSEMNQYEKCISAVGAVLTKYNKNQKFSVYGFGARISGQNNNCFPLTFDENNVEVNGLQGILDCYRSSIQKVELSGTTFFAPMIKKAAEIATKSFEDSKTYTVLLMITDGGIDDLWDTIPEVIDASDAPLSIIIIGVGNDSFSNMEMLDGDEQALSYRGKNAKRDIVQFVPFNKFKDLSPQILENAVLEEVPNQVHQYCVQHGFVPQMANNGMLS